MQGDMAVTKLAQVKDIVLAPMSILAVCSDQTAKLYKVFWAKDEENSLLYKIYLDANAYNTVALVIKKRDSWVTVSTSGELFIIVFTRARGRLEDHPGAGEAIIPIWNFLTEKYLKFDGLLTA